MVRGNVQRWTIGAFAFVFFLTGESLAAREPDLARNASPAIATLSSAAPEKETPSADKSEKPDKSAGSEDLLNLNLEQLSQTPVRTQPNTSGAAGGPAFDLPVSTVSRAPEARQEGGAAPTVGQSPAAVYVITAEEIRRSGFRHIPDLLRMVPGLDIAQIDANKWAVSSRGFNQRFANKLLVLIDGRTVYTPLFGGVFWDQIDLPVEEIERIEVIRGPGATLWGSNAVNGIISIITKNARDTLGGFIDGGGGSEERGFGYLRYGGKIGDNAFYRVWGNYFERATSLDILGQRSGDRWDNTEGGFRIDWTPSPVDTFLFSGELYSGRLGDTDILPAFTPPFLEYVRDRYSIGGGDVIGRWTHTFSETASTSFQVSYDHTERNDPLIHERRDTIDLDFQHRFALTPRQELVWGFGYRWTTNDTLGNLQFASIVPDGRTLNLESAFVQDDVTLIPDRFHWIFGTKIENNDFTGIEIQPSTRLLWTPDKKQTVWAAVSRAVRTPTQADRDLRALFGVLPPGTLGPNTPQAWAVTFGLPDFASEEEVAYELGYRVRPTDHFSLDVTGFFNDYHLLQDSAPATPFFALVPVGPHIVLPSILNNFEYGQTYGVEVASTWNVTKHWKINTAYTWFQIQLHRDPFNSSLGPEGEEDQSPHNQFNVRSYMDLPGHLEFDTGLYYVDSLRNLNVPPYVMLNARVGWHPRPNLEVVVAMQNLLNPRHQEFAILNSPTIPTFAERSIYGMVRLKF